LSVITRSTEPGDCASQEGRGGFSAFIGQHLHVGEADCVINDAELPKTLKEKAVADVATLQP
jgi:hypothetical protein